MLATAARFSESDQEYCQYALRLHWTPTFFLNFQQTETFHWQPSFVVKKMKELKAESATGSLTDSNHHFLRHFHNMHVQTKWKVYFLSVVLETKNLHCDITCSVHIWLSWILVCNLIRYNWVEASLRHHGMHICIPFNSRLWNKCAGRFKLLTSCVDTKNSDDKLTMHSALPSINDPCGNSDTTKTGADRHTACVSINISLDKKSDSVVAVLLL